MTDYQSYFDSTTQYVSVMNTKGSFVNTLPHIHNHYEIYYNIFGAKGYMVNGVFYKCCERDLIIIPRLLAHKVILESSEADYRRCIINVDEKLLSVLEMICPEKEVLKWLVEENPNAPKKTTLSKEQHEAFMKLATQYEMQNSHEESLGSLAKILAFLRVCFTNAACAEFLETDAVSNTDRILMIIEKGFTTLTVSQIAQLTHYNSDHLNRVFKAETGFTVKHYLLIRKLAESQKYLCMGKSVKEACKLSGFNNYSNFLRTFKKYLGYTPGNFDKTNIKIRKEEEK